jgi:hypothetical protein
VPFGVSAEGEAPLAAPEATQTAVADVVVAPVTEPVPAVPPTFSTAQEEAAKRVAQEEQARAALNGTRWAITWTSTAGGEAAAKPAKDTISFEERQVSSERLVKAGYPSSNYSLTIAGDGMTIWETMQTKEGEGVAFWRGEVQGDTMRGVLSKHPLEGATEDYTLSGRRISGPPTASPATASSTATTSVSADASVTVEAPAASPSKKTRKRW